MATKIDVLGKVARIDRDIEALNEKIAAKQNEKLALLNEAQAVLDALRPPSSKPKGYHGRRRGPAKGTPNMIHRSLTPKQVREIRRMAAKGISQSAIGAKFELSQPTVSSIVRRLTYQDVD
jgi:DNA-binding NarL/FixJ family response regulator